MQPKPQDYSFDLEQALGSVVSLRALVPADAFTAETLGTERAGHGVVIRKDGKVVATHRPCWGEARCAAKERILASLLGQ